MDTSVMFRVKKNPTKISAYYIGGYLNIMNKGNLTIQIKGDKLIFKRLFFKEHELNLKDITDIQFKAESEIEKDVTLCRLLAVGVFAFAFKKKRLKERYFLIITTKEDGYDNNIIFESGKGINNLLVQGFAKELRKVTNDLRAE